MMGLQQNSSTLINYQAIGGKRMENDTKHPVPREETDSFFLMSGSVTESKLSLLAAQQANNSETRC